MKRKLLLVALICLAGVVSVWAGAQNQDGRIWPTTRNVDIITPDAPSSGTDAVIRVMAKYWTQTTGSNFIVTNDPGGSGVAAFERVRNGPTDGTQFMIGLAGMLMLAKPFGIYDRSLEDFTVIGLFRVPTPYSVIAVRADSKYQTLTDLVNDAKARPGEVVVPADNGTVLVRARNFQRILGTQFRIIDGKDNADRLAKLLGGFVDFVVMTPKGVLPYVESGDLRVLCVGQNERAPDYPDFPALTEYGFEQIYPDPQGYIIAGPKNMDPKIAEAINESLKGINDDEEAKAAMYNLEQSYPMYIPRAEGLKQADELNKMCIMFGEAR